MILYFSGTGNSRYVAKIIAEKTDDDIVSINQLMKEGSIDELVSPSKPFVFVCPTYAWRIPRVVEDFKSSSIINNFFYKFFVKSKGFYSTEKSIGCRKCEQICSLNNIQMQEGKPCWNKRCTHCMACISACPTAAIEYKNKTQGKARYYLK